MYEMIVRNIDAAIVAAINATTEEEYELYSRDARWWKAKKAEFEKTHTLEDVCLT